MQAIVLAAGMGMRLGKSIPKQFYRIGGKPILAATLERLRAVKAIETIFVTYLPGSKLTYEELFKTYNIKNIVLVKGGRTRQESVWNALQKIETDRVLVHEAARPFLTLQLVERLLEFDDAAVVPTIPISFTVSRGRAYMEGELNRAELHNIQLPQIFRTTILRNAHEEAKKSEYIATEDSALVFRIGEKVRFIEGDESNIKITTPLDIIIAENFYNEPT